MQLLISWLFTRIIAFALVCILVLAGAAAAVYYSGVSVPLVADVAPLSYQNWNKTKDLNGQVSYRSTAMRRAGRIHVTADLAFPETVARMRDFLDGGRSMIVACGPQKLFLHKLQGAKIEVDKPTIWIAGEVDMELEGFISARDDWPVAVLIETGHDRTTIWADLKALRIADVPPQMVKSLRENVPRLTYTREQVLDMAAASLPEDLASLLKTHRDALDLAFEDITPRKEGDDVMLDATFSVDEDVAFRLLRDKMLASGPVRAMAGLISPLPANAQLFDQLKELTDSLDLDEGAKQFLKDLEEGKSPEDILQNTLTALSDCQTTF